MKYREAAHTHIVKKLRRALLDVAQMLCPHCPFWCSQRCKTKCPVGPHHPSFVRRGEEGPSQMDGRERDLRGSCPGAAPREHSSKTSQVSSGEQLVPRWGD